MSNNWVMEIPFGSWYGIVLFRRGVKLRVDPVNNSLVIEMDNGEPATAMPFWLPRSNKMLQHMAFYEYYISRSEGEFQFELGNNEISPCK